APDMKRTCDDYLDSQQFMDIQVLSTLGLTDDDLTALLAADGIGDGEAAYVIDAFASAPGLDIVTKVYSLPRRLNQPVVTAGRLPVSDDECLADRQLTAALGLTVGDTVTLKTQGDFEDSLARKRYTIVGEAVSPAYINMERGTSTLGSGHVAAYLFLPESAFTMDNYTAIFLQVEGGAAEVAYSDAYNTLVEDEVDALEPLAKERAKLRRSSLVDEANEKLADAQIELDDAKAEAAQKLGDAQIELDDARGELDDGWHDLAEARVTLTTETADAEKKIADAQIELDDALKKLDDGVLDYAEGQEDYARGQRDLDKGIREYEDGNRKYEDGLKTYATSKKELDEALMALDSGEEDLLAGQATLTQGQQQFAQLMGGVTQMVNGVLQTQHAPLFPADGGALLTAMADPATAAMVDGILNQALQNPQAAQLKAGLEQLRAATGAATYSAALLGTQQQLKMGEAAFQEGAAEFSSGWAQYEDGKKKLQQAKVDLEAAKLEIDRNRKKLVDGQRELDDAKIELADAKTKLDDGWSDYADGKQELADARQELIDQVADAKREIADAEHDLRQGEIDYQDGLAEYRDKKAEAEEKIADGEKELADARRKIADIGDSEWYVLDRDSNPGYLAFGQDADRMANLATVLPLLFFLVAALVCLTTMTRMVEEQRVQIGCLKALGYSRFSISRKYLGYGLLPALLGSGLGLAIGYTLFPKMIFTAYQIMYQVPDIQLHTYGDITALSLLASVFCTTVSTLWACLSTLSSTAAELMRPRAPKPGKRVLLEYIRPLWRRMSFNLKVTARNLFRYQKRFWMTVIGIGGCTALIIAGFGLRSSLLVSMVTQYDDLYHYTAQLITEDNLLDTERAAIDDYLRGEPDVLEFAAGRMVSVTAESPAYSTTSYLEVAKAADVGEFVTLRDSKTAEPLTLTDDGVIITQKLSELLGVSAGESFTVDGDSRREVMVTGVTEHYLAHFIYLTPAYYEKVFGQPAAANAYLLTLSSEDEALCDRVFADLMQCSGVLSATRNLDTRDTYQHSMERIDFVVVIVILSAAALALVVLYNLSNINITERQRELATIRVLGFYDSEVSAYVYRENIVLTAAGIGLGLLLGRWLHLWLVRSVEIDLMMFGRETDPWAYFFAALLTTGFSVAVNLMA
ncbi:MAG: FtsX-like permease family protein, partial [Oscillospiraceae bacterium]